MSEEIEKPPESKQANSCGEGCGLIFGIIAAIFIVLMFTGKGCTCSHSDDTWDRLEHSIKTDPSYKQWD